MGSVRGQSIREMEIFIIGDGVNDKNREVIGRLQLPACVFDSLQAHSTA